MSEERVKSYEKWLQEGLTIIDKNWDLDFPKLKDFPTLRKILSNGLHGEDNDMLPLRQLNLAVKTMYYAELAEAGVVRDSLRTSTLQLLNDLQLSGDDVSAYLGLISSHNSR